MKMDPVMHNTLQMLNSSVSAQNSAAPTSVTEIGTFTSSAKKLALWETQKCYSALVSTITLPLLSNRSPIYPISKLLIQGEIGTKLGDEGENATWRGECVRCSLFY